MAAARKIRTALPMLFLVVNVAQILNASPFSIKPDSALGDLTTSGNDRPLNTTFPFLPSPHPLPGDSGTIGFPPQQ